MISVQNLTYTYPLLDSISFPDFKLEKGEKLLLLGQSGCGKTTLLHLLGGLLKIQKGNVLIDNQSLADMNSSQLDAFRGQNIGIIFQKPHFVKSLTVLENLKLTQSLSGDEVDVDFINSLLNKLNIGDKKNKYPQNLSQGEQQRVAIARALSTRPHIILADEPTSALDDNNTKEVIDLLEQQASEQKANLIIVTHDNRLKEHFKNRIEL